MKRVLAPLLVGLGVFLLTLAVLLPTVVLPRVEKAPLDTYEVTQATGTGSYLDPTTLEFVEDDEITVTRVIRGDVEESGDDIAMYDVSQTVESGQVDEPLNVVVERVRFDRSTGEGVGGPGDRPDHEGAYVVKFPFDTERTEYLYHDATAAEAYPVSFQQVTEVDGLEVYEFSGTVPEVQRDTTNVPGELVGADRASVLVDEFYTNETTLLVEPRTGSIVSTSSSPRRVWRPADFAGQGGEETTIFEAQVDATDETVADLAADARESRDQLNLVGRTLPIIFGILGLAAIAVGLLLLLRGEPEPEYYEDEETLYRDDDGIDLVR